MIKAFINKEHILGLFISSLVLIGCTKEEVKELKLPVNSFSMYLNGNHWQPYTPEPCYSTFIGSMSLLNEQPFYTITAYKDSKGATDYLSDYQLRIQIMDVLKPGIYPTRGTYEQDFDSYAIYIDRENISSSEKGTRYINKREESSFFVQVDEILKIEGLSSKGIQGSFYGALYNESNPQDSIVIEQGEFTFRTVNRNFNQCEYID